MIDVKVTCEGRTSMCKVLPDSGADICAAGFDFLKTIKKQSKDLASSDVRPEAVNGQRMNPIGSTTVVLEYGDRKTKERIHIYKGIRGALISWQACKTLGILPESYPKPLLTIKTVKDTATTGRVQAKKIPETKIKINQVTAAELMDEFKTVFDGKIRTMPGEEYRIVLTDDAKPFCVSTPRTVPLPLMQPLKDELDLLEDMNIIRSVTEPTDWCSPISIAMKKD